MGIIVNPRGTAGSGKTELVRRILAGYGWPESGEPMERPGQDRPLAWLMRHPLGLRPLAVLGHYGGTVGGCDTISTRDGGLAGALGLAGRLASSGHDVLLEGLRLSEEVELTASLAARHRTCILRLTTPPEDCLRYLRRRRRCGPAALPALTAKVAREHAAVKSACARLAPCMDVVHLPFDAALATALSLLGLAPVGATACAAADQ
jgi:hypothetical protein